MNCQDFQHEIEGLSELTGSAEVHLAECPDCWKVNYQQMRLAEMLGGLPRVAAPADFDHHLKARIATRKSASGRASLFPALRYLFPLSGAAALLVTAALSWIFIFDGKSPEGDTARQIPVAKETAEPVSDKENNEISSPVSLPGNEDIADTGANRKLAQNTPETAKNAAVVENRVRTVTRTSRLPEDDGGGSRDLVFSRGKTIEPPGINTNSPTVAPEIVTVTDLNEVWALIGITTTKENRRLKVSAVAENSVAERADVRVGDEIDAIDGVKITGEPLRGVSINIRSLTVLRDGRQKEIALQAKSQ